ncbi:beta-1,3-galactosyltransferase 1-like [Mytilus californianus]|uniref:beta-1,3-galactosyltransferase 1-like n=1 Tax=Mytilus californianus TaxID=6549 RepID=UPI0022451E0F|nr:beta-1,3-galactosyltransferase 1-like [Mytilus californianus]
MRVYNSSLQHAIEQENLVFHDIIEGKFIDSYRNLTLKGVLGFKRISENCRNAEFVAKIDDDVIVNFFKLLRYFSFIKLRRYLMCNKVKSNVFPIQRNASDKWNVFSDEFKRMIRYPYTSCLGPAVFISKDLIPIVYTTASMSQFFWIVDIYLFGILPSKIPGLVYHRINQNVSYTYQYTADCFGKQKKECDLIVEIRET